MKMISFLNLAAVAGLSFAAASAQASIITFDITDTANYDVSENFPEGYGVPGDYGDRISSLSTTSGTVTYGYGVGAEGFTPNVLAEYGPFSIFTGGPTLWRYDYGDLDRVLYQGSTFTGIGNDYNHLDIVLTADPFFDVVLYDLDLGGYQGDFQINAVVVYDGVPFPFLTPTNQIETISPVDAPGAGHTTVTFSSPIQAHQIWLSIDARNLGADSEKIGVDNIRFGQVERTNGPGDIRSFTIDEDGQILVVPEPAPLAAWLLGGAAIFFARRRHCLSV